MPEPIAKSQQVDPGAQTVGLVPDSAVSRPDPRIGTLLKETYEIERLIGVGGMAHVYEAQHALIHKKVAIKILAPEYAKKPELKERFLREARAAAAIDHDHVIEIHDFGETPEGAAFFVMEHLEGEDLAAVIERDAPLPWPRARDIALQLCRALQAAHDRGIVHRDMKPSNCFCLARDGLDFVKVLDFGIAKLQNPDEGLGHALTRTGMIFGTPEYMSPEQAQGEPHDHRVDIYAVGVILFEMLTGETPFIADTFMSLLNKHMFEAPPRPRDVSPEADIPEAAELVVLKALQKDPALRFQTMDELAEALRAVDDGVAPELVPEILRSRPPRGEPMQYRTPDDPPRPTIPPTAPDSEPPPPTPRRRLGVALVAGLSAALITAVAAALLPDDGAGPPREAPLPPSPPAPAGPPLPALPPPPGGPLELGALPSPTVTVRLDTGGVAAQVLDETDAILGSTTDLSGLVVPRAATERVLRLRAEGHVETTVKLVPLEDLTLTVQLEPAPAASPSPAKTAAKKGAKTEVKPDKSSTSPDLIPPFKD